ncbi:MAG TPA: hypothetical protein PKH39_19315 [Woeseiaceae bacterium]|nr:hypothetical protein [Woeseiaceae bacterium]
MKLVRIAMAASATLLLLVATGSNAEDWARQSFDVKGVKKAILTFEYPLSWGKKPKYKTFDNITDISFGPYGPKSKPLFLVHLQSVPTIEVITAEQLKKIAESDVRLLAEEAFESEIPINELQGPNNRILYYTITDKEKKWGEFDYLTKAVVASGALLTNVYFFSSDGAPDFGSDALRMMESIKFTPPPDGEKDK